MSDGSERINGWKSIAAFFGRDRTTVMRWASERSLPIHRYPGGKKGGVFAVRSELESWYRLNDAAVLDPTLPRSGSSMLFDRLRPYGWIVLTVIAVGLLIALVSRPLGSTAIDETTGVALPKNVDVAALYLQARDNWASREADKIEVAIDQLHRVIDDEPDFAPAHAALAETYLLAREFGKLSDDMAFPKADVATRDALRLDPGLPSAHRAQGFIAYWWDGDAPFAGRAFRRALQLSPDSAQSHFWYGNVLSDNGEHKQGLKELDRARLLQPGSVAIQTDYAWALWAAGQNAKAKAELDTLARANPRFAVIHECLASIHLADGNFDGFVEEQEILAQLRGNAAMQGDARALRAALVEGPPQLQALVMAQAMREFRAGSRRNLSWPSFVASAFGDRPQLVALLTQAERRKERWGNAALMARMADRWRADAEIMALLKKRQRPPVA